MRLQQLASSKLCFQTGSGATAPANNSARFAVPGPPTFGACERWHWIPYGMEVSSPPMWRRTRRHFQDMVGEVQSWADYRFAVEALEKKEAQIAEGERKKLGPLALRLTERLVGPALQVAKKVGVEKLSQPDGVKVLLEALEKRLLPLRKQAALELYRAGMREGILSRQTGEPMSSYCLRREAWWTQLRDMEPEHSVQ